MKCQCIRMLAGGYRQQDCPHDATWVVEALPVIERKYVCRFHIGAFRKLKVNHHGYPRMTIERVDKSAK